MLLAHADGASWDEFLLAGVPLVLIGIALWIAKRRADRGE